MSNAQARQDIMQYVSAAKAADRAAHLLDRIKIEARWLLLSSPARPFRIDDDHYAADRAVFVGVWPAIRHRRLDCVATFYDIVGDQASLLVHLIEIRRQRAADRRAQ